MCKASFRVEAKEQARPDRADDVDGRRWRHLLGGGQGLKVPHEGPWNVDHPQLPKVLIDQHAL